MVTLAETTVAFCFEKFLYRYCAYMVQLLAGSLQTLWSNAWQCNTQLEMLQHVTLS